MGSTPLVMILYCHGCRMQRDVQCALLRQLGQMPDINENEELAEEEEDELEAALKQQEKAQAQQQLLQQQQQQQPVVSAEMNCTQKKRKPVARRAS